MKRLILGGGVAALAALGLSAGVAQASPVPGQPTSTDDLIAWKQEGAQAAYDNNISVSIYGNTMIMQMCKTAFQERHPSIPLQRTHGSVFVAGCVNWAVGR